MKMELPAPYVARPYRGPEDHSAMASILSAYRQYCGNLERVNAEQIGVSYANLTNCDTETDIVLIEAGDESVAYGQNELGRPRRRRT